MPDWIARLHHSRRARNWTLGAIGFLTLGSCGGALLANYTMAGVDPRFAAARAEVPELATAEPASDWVRDVKVLDPGTDEDRAEYQRVSY